MLLVKLYYADYLFVSDKLGKTLLQLGKENKQFSSLWQRVCILRNNIL